VLPHLLVVGHQQHWQKVDHHPIITTPAIRSKWLPEWYVKELVLDTPAWFWTSGMLTVKNISLSVNSVFVPFSYAGWSVLRS
jgi:hypothetical protein